MLGAVILLIILILINAVFTCAETAVKASSQMKLEVWAEDGNEKAKRLLTMMEDSTNILYCIHIATTLISVISGAYAACVFAPVLAAFIAEVIPSVAIYTVQIENVCLVLITFALSFIGILLGESIPKRFTMRSPERAALGLFGILKLTLCIFKPFVFLITLFTNGVPRLFGVDPKETADNVTEEDIISMLDTGSEMGTIDSAESEMIQNVFEFDDISVSELCTHRLKVTFLYMDDSVEVWRETVAKTRHIYYPICGENEDDIVAVLNIRKFFGLDSDDIQVVINEAADKPCLVPESKKANSLLADMKKTRNYFAVVIDEYGGTRGVITLHDILEPLVGDLGDEDEDPREEIKVVGDNTWEILGSASIGDVEKALDMELDDEDSDTFGGYVLGVLSMIPDDGATPELETEDLRIKVESVVSRRIEKTLVIRKTEDEKEEERKRKMKEED